MPALGLAGLAGRHLDFCRDHKGGIKADAELTDQAHVLARVARQLIEKGGRAGPGDRAEIFDQLVPVHADAVIGDRQGAGGLVGGQHDAIDRVAAGQRRLGQRRIAQPVAGIRGVGNKLAQEDLLFAVKRMRDNFEKAADFRLEAPGFLGHRLPLPSVGTRRGYVAQNGPWQARWPPPQTIASASAARDRSASRVEAPIPTALGLLCRRRDAIP